MPQSLAVGGIGILGMPCTRGFGGVLRVTFRLVQGLAGYVRPAVFARPVLSEEGLTPGLRQSRNG